MTYCIVFCTCPTREMAEKIATELTQQKLIACTNIISDLTSIYFWKNAIKNDSEVCMIMKTQQAKLPQLEKAIIALHPYEFPEFIALPILYGNAAYLKWIDEVVGTP